MDTLPSVDDATVERQLRFHERINRAAFAISGVIAADVIALYLGALPVALRVYIRPVLVFAVTGLFALEAWRHLGYGQQGRLRWTRLALVACMGALAIGQALHHIWPSLEMSSERELGIAVTAIAITLVCDLREFTDRSRYGSMARTGMALGVVGTTLMAATLLGEQLMPFVLWRRLLFGSAALIAVASGIYLRARRVLRSARAP